jgi:glycosyltransferase involved in cell wall biosynthesis
VGGVQAGALMRVGLIIYGDLETLTGGYMYDRMLVDYLRARGDQVEVISLSRRNYGRHLTDNFSRHLLRRLQDTKFDALIQDELNHPSLFLLNARLKRRVHYPIVTLVHLLRSSESRPARLRRAYAAVERRYFETVSGAIFNCNTTRDAVKQLLGRDIPGVVAYPGRDHLRYEISLEEVAERARRPGPLRIIFLANVVPGKGLNTLIEALGHMMPGSWRLMVVGSLTMDSSYSNSIRDQIARNGLSDYVDIVGAVPNDEIPGYLVKNHVLVVPSRYEALGIVYLEAMGCGLPVIATAAGGAHEIVSHGEVGFLTPPGDAGMLAQYLRQINQERGQLLDMSLAAYKRISAHPTWDQSFGRVRDFLQSLVTG